MRFCGRWFKSYHMQNSLFFFFTILYTSNDLQRKNNELDEEMLALTAGLLSNIPEFSTLWNIRRELIEDWAANRLHIRMFNKTRSSAAAGNHRVICVLFSILVN